MLYWRNYLRTTVQKKRASVRRKRKVAITREAIVEAASRAFARRGFASATMREIAKEAGYTAPALYVYFRSKQEILRALVETLLADVMKSFEVPPVSHASFRQNVELLVGQQLAMADRKRDSFALVFPLRAFLDEAHPSRPRETVFLSYCSRLTAWMEVNGAGILAHPEDAAFALAGILYTFFIRWLESTKPRPLPEFTGRIVDLFLNGALGGSR